MVTYHVPVLIKGYAIVKYPQARGAGDYTGGLPRDAENEAFGKTPFICSARMEECTVALAGQARIAE